MELKVSAWSLEAKVLPLEVKAWSLEAKVSPLEVKAWSLEAKVSPLEVKVSSLEANFSSSTRLLVGPQMVMFPSLKVKLESPKVKLESHPYNNSHPLRPTGTPIWGFASKT